MRIAVCAALFAGFVLSYKLWLSSRLYPFSPVWFFRPLPIPFDRVLFAALLGLLPLIAVVRKPRWLIGAFALLAAAAALQDQSRWQPWFYQEAFMLLAMGHLGGARQDAGLRTCRLILVAIYFWSGLQKFNPNFVHGMFPFLVEAVLRFRPQGQGIAALAYAAPLFETGISAGLLFHRTRRTTVLCAVAMHGFILAAIGPFGENYNFVVWPWNLAMIAFLFLLFWRSADSPREILWGGRSPLHQVTLLLFGLAPALSFFSLWDAYPSFALYSGNRNAGFIYMSDASYDRLPVDLDDYVYELTPNVNRLAIAEWSLGELNVPQYAEIRIFRNVARYVCSVTGNPPEMKLVVRRKLAPFGDAGELVYTCANLRP